MKNHFVSIKQGYYNVLHCLIGITIPNLDMQRIYKPAYIIYHGKYSKLEISCMIHETQWGTEPRI